MQTDATANDVWHSENISSMKQQKKATQKRNIGAPCMQNEADRGAATRGTAKISYP